MSAVLNTNTASLWAAKNLLGAQNRLAASVERLSSGLRINRARDDAAGLGVANSLTAQINGANQGIRNLNDAISMVQTAEGAIAAASDMAQRMLMLATQGANGTLGKTEREAIQSELKQLLLSIDSIGGRTNFSNNPLLAYDVEAAAETSYYSMQISNTASDRVSLSSDAFERIGGFMIKANAGATATALVLSESVPSSVAVNDKVYQVTVAGVVTDTGSTVSAISADRKTITLSGSETWLATDSFMFGSQGLATDILSSTGGDLSLAQAAVSANLTSDTAATATTAFQMVQRAANAYVVQLGKQRSLLGAYQNQMEFTLANITELSSNLSSARSRVIDTDYASETAALTRGQILQQAATAMLAQANQMPNVILTLLK